MTKQYQGWYKTTPRLGESLPPLPKVIGKEFIIKVQPNFPPHWDLAKIDFVGKIGKCVFVRRQWTPPFAPVCQLEIPLESEPVYWDFLVSNLEEVKAGE